MRIALAPATLASNLFGSRWEWSNLPRLISLDIWSQWLLDHRFPYFPDRVYSFVEDDLTNVFMDETFLSFTSLSFTSFIFTLAAIPSSSGSPKKNESPTAGAPVFVLGFGFKFWCSLRFGLVITRIRCCRCTSLGRCLRVVVEFAFLSFGAVPPDPVPAWDLPFTLRRGTS